MLFSDEKTLLKRCLNQDKKAWDIFVEKYNRIIYNAIIRTLKKHSFPTENQVVDDLFQTVFLSLLESNCKKLRQFEWKCKLSSWIHIIAARTTIDFLNKQTRQVSLNGDTEEEKSIKKKTSNGRPNPGEMVEQKEERKILEQLIDMLNPKERLFIELYYDKDLSSSEVSKIMNIEPNYMYLIKNRVREKMKEMVKDFV